jgi:hypothetical protein
MAKTLKRRHKNKKRKLTTKNISCQRGGYTYDKKTRTETTNTTNTTNTNYTDDEETTRRHSQQRSKHRSKNKSKSKSRK